MTADDAATADVLRRLRRVEGQIGGIIRMIEQGRSCADVVTQLAAASRALDRAGFRIIANGLRECVLDGDKPSELTPDQLERLFLSLA